MAQLGQQQGQPGGGAHTHGQGQEDGLVPFHTFALTRLEQGQEQEAGAEEEDQPGQEGREWRHQVHATSVSASRTASATRLACASLISG